MRTMILAAALLVAPGTAGAAVKTKVIEYEYDGVKLKGYLAYDDAGTGKRPGVLVFHEFWGLDSYAKKRAEQLAELGYVAFCPDMYGDGKVAEHPAEAAKMAGTVRENEKGWLGRAEAGLKALRSQSQVDGDKVAAIGYCFGGSTALKLALSGSPLKAVVTFHGALPVPTAAEAKAIKARVLVCHGSDDPFIPAETVSKFKEALDAAKVNYQFESYPDAVHSFSVPEADKRGLKGMAYNEAADKKSWQQMKTVLSETLGK
jgi:dienelactone hydrolase